MRLILIFTVLISVLSPVFADISSGLAPGECWELIPGHRACCGDNVCSTDALETCAVCEEDCFCAPNFECNPFASDENRRHLADDRGCAPAGYDTLPQDGADNEPASSDPCGAIVVVLAPLFFSVAKI